MNKVQQAYEDIHASEALKSRTLRQVSQAAAAKQHRASFIPHRKFIYAFCLCLVCLVIGSFSYTYTMVPVSYVSIDINPSIELSLNRRDHVIAASAYNEDGAEVLSHLSLKGCTYDEALLMISEACSDLHYLNDDSLLQITIISPVEERLIQKTDAFCEAQNQAHICEQGLSELTGEAHDQGLSFGKYQAFLELQAADDSYTIEDIRHMSMRDLHDLIDRACGEGSHASGNKPDCSDPSDSADHSGNGSSNGNGNNNDSGSSNGNGNNNDSGSGSGNGNGSNPGSSNGNGNGSGNGSGSQGGNGSGGGDHSSDHNHGNSHE